MAHAITRLTLLLRQKIEVNVKILQVLEQLTIAVQTLWLIWYVILIIGLNHSRPPTHHLVATHVLQEKSLSPVKRLQGTKNFTFRPRKQLMTRLITWQAKSQTLTWCCL